MLEEVINRKEFDFLLLRSTKSRTPHKVSFVLGEITRVSTPRGLPRRVRKFAKQT